MRFHDRFKTLVFNDKLIHISIADENEEKRFDREQIWLETMAMQEDKHLPTKNELGLTYYEQRKINEQNLKEMKQRMAEHIHKRTQDFRMLKSEVKNELYKDF